MISPWLPEWGHSIYRTLWGIFNLLLDRKKHLGALPDWVCGFMGNKKCDQSQKSLSLSCQKWLKVYHEFSKSLVLAVSLLSFLGFPGKAMVLGQPKFGKHPQKTGFHWIWDLDQKQSMSQQKLQFRWDMRDQPVSKSGTAYLTHKKDIQVSTARDIKFSRSPQVGK